MCNMLHYVIVARWTREWCSDCVIEPCDSDALLDGQRRSEAEKVNLHERKHA